MSDPRVFDAASEIARRLKVDKARGATTDEQADLRTTVLFAKADKVMGMIMVGHGPNAAREAAYAAAKMFQPDAVLLVADSYIATVTPDEVDTIKQGAMQEAWQAGNRDGISEALMVMKIPRDGVPTGEHWKYTRTGQVVTWGERQEGGGMTGPVVDYAREGWSHGTRGVDQDHRGARRRGRGHDERPARPGPHEPRRRPVGVRAAARGTGGALRGQGGARVPGG